MTARNGAAEPRCPFRLALGAHHVILSLIRGYCQWVGIALGSLTTCTSGLQPVRLER